MSDGFREPFLGVEATAHYDFLRLKNAARQALRRAVRDGVVDRPDRCMSCGKPGQPEAHHYAGYGQFAWLVMQWLCRKCHSREDAPSRTFIHKRAWISPELLTSAQQIERGKGRLVWSPGENPKVVHALEGIVISWPGIGLTRVLPGYAQVPTPPTTTGF